ncbi:MAG TPA: hypothetical protein VK009_28505 [Chloroflexota bacterium]|nr:hypothetical protein [Chloroflexota bacterium]
MFKRREREPAPVNLWGHEFDERRVPVWPDSVELERLMVRLQALADLRGEAKDIDVTNDILNRMQAEIEDAMSSPTKHRDWREARPRVLALLTELGQVLYQQFPEPED